MKKKRLLTIVLTTTLLVVNGLSVNAMEDIAAQQESIKQEQIENLFEELNSLAAIKVNCEYLEAKGIINSKLMTTGINEPLQKNQYEQRAYELEQQLEELGVHKIDAGNKEDLNLLEELGNTSETSVCSSVYDFAPDLSAVANAYTLYTYDGSVTHNGSVYNYRYIKVIDNKGYNGLTSNQELNAIANLSYAQLGTSILSFNFNYGLSLLAGQTPVGLVTHWTLGNIFNILENQPTAQISSSGGSIYRIFHTGVTSMTYYYLYNNGWRLIGVGAAADIIRDDYFAGNVNGTPRTELNTVNFKITTNGILRNYIDTYLNYMSTNPSYCLTNELGTLQVNGYSNSLNYTPAYASRPAELVK